MNYWKVAKLAFFAVGGGALALAGIAMVRNLARTGYSSFVMGMQDDPVTDAPREGTDADESTTGQS